MFKKKLDQLKYELIFLNLYVCTLYVLVLYMLNYKYVYDVSLVILLTLMRGLPTLNVK